MVVAGIPIPTPVKEKHAQQIAFMSLAVKDTIKRFSIKHLADHDLDIRIGIHSGILNFYS